MIDSLKKGLLDPFGSLSGCRFPALQSIRPLGLVCKPTHKNTSHPKASDALDAACMDLHSASW